MHKIVSLNKKIAFVLGGSGLIGLEVINQQQVVLGKVSNLVDTGANNVLVVNGDKEHWVPYIEPFLISVDLDKQQILVDWDEDF